MKNKDQKSNRKVKFFQQFSQVEIQKEQQGKIKGGFIGVEEGEV